jgi:hypothetical protein
MWAWVRCITCNDDSPLTLNLRKLASLGWEESWWLWLYRYFFLTLCVMILEFMALFLGELSSPDYACVLAQPIWGETLLTAQTKTILKKILKCPFILYFSFVLLQSNYLVGFVYMMELGAIETQDYFLKLYLSPRDLIIGTQNEQVIYHLKVGLWFFSF